MPKVTPNDDGTTTFSVNSSELRALSSVLTQGGPDLKKVLDFVDGPGLKAALEFVRSLVS